MNHYELSSDDLSAVERCQGAYQRVRRELAKAIVGQDDVIEQVLVAILAKGHALLEGVPGLAKTLLVSSLAEALHLSFKRIQFTPDLMPSDVTGAEVIQEDPDTRQRAYRFLPGPIFANLLLADEINRTPPKTQAAMLEAMQERQIRRWRRDAYAAFAVLCSGHAEPLGARGDLSTARGPARPILAAYSGGLPQRPRGVGDRAAGHGRVSKRRSRLACRATTSCSCSDWFSECRLAIRCWATPGRWPAHRVLARTKRPSS